MDHSQYILEALQKIKEVRGQSLTVEKRRETAIELAALMLNESRRIQTNSEKSQQAQLARMMEDPKGKIFTTCATDQCFRSNRSARVAEQLCYLIDKWGIPQFLAYIRKIGLYAFRIFGQTFPKLFVSRLKHAIREETSKVILPGEPSKLAKHMATRRKEGVRINLNHLGEAILGEVEAKRRLKVYLDDLKKPELEYISVKISTICSQLNLLAWEDTLEILSDRLRQLFRTAKDNLYVRTNGEKVSKFVNLDMEEYRDLNLTVDIFKRVLNEPEFFNYSAGLVLQSYLPDSYPVQQELTAWAMERVALGGAPIKIRLVKGANLAMERVEASIRGWPQAPYVDKGETDANFKRMLSYGSIPEHAQAANLGIASHNLFDIAYALLLRSENQIEKYVCFEMLEGMADHTRRVVQTLSDDMLLYCPAANRDEFQNAVAYLIRRLDENTAPENFLRHLFAMHPGSQEWASQAAAFSHACQSANEVSYASRRTQDRFAPIKKPSLDTCFVNEPDTDWSLAQNRKWAESIISHWKQIKIEPIPLVIGGESIINHENSATGMDPSYPNKILYHYSLANANQINKALDVALQARKEWSPLPFTDRSKILAEIAHKLRAKRNLLVGAMLADTGKTIPEADVEVSEAIDFAEYYRHIIEELLTMQDISWEPKGTVLVTPPWNFPCSIPAGGILAALATGNTVIFKPAPESVLVGWILVQIFWEAGVSKKVLQFINCEDEPTGSDLIKDPRISMVVLTGATATAKLFMRLRPGLDLAAETGGKNAIIVTSMADRDLAIKDIIQSAFGHAGQKCSACSLAILEAEIYDDPHFSAQLRDAAASWKVGVSWDLATRLNPLIHSPNPTLLRGLTQLEDGEEWLLKPEQDPHNPNLWSASIKWGVKKGSFTHQNELFGPVLGVMRAENLQQAIELANATPYGLTSGLHSLDEREHQIWINQIESGNCYINRGITGAIVQRQPFGGCKASSFGQGHKAGGPNYLTQLMRAKQISMPQEGEEPVEEWNSLATLLPSEMQHIWKASLASYTFYRNHYFNKWHDPSCGLGQDNYLIYVPHKKVVYRIQKEDALLDKLRVIAAARICGTPLEVSGDLEQIEKLSSITNVNLKSESESEFITRVSKGSIHRLRLVSNPDSQLERALAEVGCNINRESVLANGRIELLNYLREVSLSVDYHRYGNLGDREKTICPNCTCLKKN